MTLILRDGKLYEQTISEVEVDIKAERYKLSAWKSAVESDIRENKEYKAKVADIDTLLINDEQKEILKNSVSFYSPSGIKQKMVDDLKAKVSEIEAFTTKVLPVLNK